MTRNSYILDLVTRYSCMYSGPDDEIFWFFRLVYKMVLDSAPDCIKFLYSRFNYKTFLYSRHDYKRFLFSRPCKIFLYSTLFYKIFLFIMPQNKTFLFSRDLISSLGVSAILIRWQNVPCALNQIYR
jgi:hypothetical protein